MMQQHRMQRAKCVLRKGCQIGHDVKSRLTTHWPMQCFLVMIVRLQPSNEKPNLAQVKPRHSPFRVSRAFCPYAKCLKSDEVWCVMVCIICSRNLRIFCRPFIHTQIRIHMSCIWFLVEFTELWFICSKQIAINYEWYDHYDNKADCPFAASAGNDGNMPRIAELYNS